MRIGKISYTNVLPVFYFFQDAKFAGQASFIEKVPAELNRHLAAGEIDLGPVSSFTYAENDGAYNALEDLSVSALGAVGSIFLFSKFPLEELKEPRIALTNTSATSVNLLKVIMEKFQAAHPQYVTMKPSLEQMMDQADAALLIGDDALMAKLTNPGYYVYDLGELWYKHTGMWMTFALWCVRKDVIATEPSLLGNIHLEFLRAKKQGAEQLDDIIRHSQREFGGSYEFWKGYFSGLCHDFQSEQKRGLEYYFRCAAEIGLLARPVEVITWGAGARIT
ncbi:menaquinone biosynthetic enzyme MqnA/MqnD family protein [Ammoniphilus sp. YIM 78166]|uniref:menaquinone biosynthetic enzyme MqnA/MqnD family protein n=1 Tax=Ammoniphilus sp. YIM 78166 TaxID=1644106 RepID=UPI00107034A4|nr:menaquinone biosynthesis protein [Ammoniphilus sp. YIM 78166]